MKRECVVIKSFQIEKHKQTKIFEVRLPRGLENIIGVELGFSLTEGSLPESASVLAPVGSGSDDRFLVPLNIRRNLCVGELRLQNISKANLFYAGEISIDRNIDNADFTSQFFAPKVFTHQAHALETEVKINAKNRVIRGIYRDKFYEHVHEAYKYTVSVYIWTTKKDIEK